MADEPLDQPHCVNCALRQAIRSVYPDGTSGEEHKDTLEALADITGWALAGLSEATLRAWLAMMLFRKGKHELEEAAGETAH